MGVARGRFRRQIGRQTTSTVSIPTRKVDESLRTGIELLSF
jgi:hypothetical protein